MVSYRTLIFGTIAVISASAPAVAAGLSPLPSPQQSRTTMTQPGAGLTPMPSKVQLQQAHTGGNIVTVILDSIGRFERELLNLAH